MAAELPLVYSPFAEGLRQPALGCPVVWEEGLHSCGNTVLSYHDTQNKDLLGSPAQKHGLSQPAAQRGDAMGVEALLPRAGGREGRVPDSGFGGRGGNLQVNKNKTTHFQQ